MTGAQLISPQQVAGSLVAARSAVLQRHFNIHPSKDMWNGSVGAWLISVQHNGIDPGGGGVMWSSETGAYRRWRTGMLKAGTWRALVQYRNQPDGGVMDFKITDLALNAIGGARYIDQYAATDVPAGKVENFTIPSDGEYLVFVRVNGTKSAASSGTEITFCGLRMDKTA